MRLWDRLIRRDSGYWEGLASGASVLTSSYGSPDREAVLPQLAAFAQQASASSSPVFAALLVRMALFSEARFQFQALDDRHLFGTTALAKLEHPFGPDTTTGNLLARMEQDAFLAGQAYIWDAPGEDRLVRCRPDWTTIISEVVHVDGGGWYRRKVGYWWEPPKGLLDRQGDGFMIPADEMVHWAPIPDPQADFRGMTPLTAAVRDIQGDDGMARYKLRYLSNDATPNMIIKYSQRLAEATIDKIRERTAARYSGPDNAGKTLILDGGADLTLAGNSLSQMDFSNVQAVGQERILAACSVPGVLVGLEPLRGAGRGYQESMQKLANIWARPEWRSACGALGKIVDVPGGNRLWFDVSDIAALQDGEMERGQAALVRAQALLALVQAGYTHESAIAAVDAMDLSQLKAGGVGTPASSAPVQHLLGQQQPGAVATPLPPTNPRLPVGSTSPGDGGNGSRPLPRASAARRALNGHDAYPFELGRSEWDPGKHPRDLKGEFAHVPGLGLVSKLTGDTAHLNDEQYAAHTRLLEQRLTDALGRGESTDAKYAVDAGRGIWEPDRARIHKEIVNDLYERQAKGVPSDGEAVIAGGLGGAGKSTVLKGPAGIDPHRYITLNPDDVKEEMTRRGLVPHVEGLSPMEASALIHEESSHITNLLAKVAYANKKNVIWDITMSGRGSVERRIAELRAAGYHDIRGVFVDIPVETSVQRALARHRRGLTTPLGGRYVPPSIIRKNASSRASSANREVFDALRHQFDHWSLYDNSGTAPRRVASSLVTAASRG